MKFVLFVEGHTEHKSLAPFLKRWLDPRLKAPVGITSIRFQGCDEFLKDINRRIGTLFSGKTGDDIMAAIGFLDLYGLRFPKQKKSVAQRFTWAKENIESKVNQPRYRQFFAVHEVEALLLSDPAIFPAPIARTLTKKASNPERINFEEPPAKFLMKLYRKHLRKNYKKTIMGNTLFNKLNPEKVTKKCPYFAKMLNEMLKIAKDHGL